MTPGLSSTLHPMCQQNLALPSNHTPNASTAHPACWSRMAKATMTSRLNRGNSSQWLPASGLAPALRWGLQNTVISKPSRGSHLARRKSIEAPRRPRVPASSPAARASAPATWAPCCNPNTRLPSAPGNSSACAVPAAWSALPPDGCVMHGLCSSGLGQMSPTTRFKAAPARGARLPLPLPEWYLPPPDSGKHTCFWSAPALWNKMRRREGSTPVCLSVWVDAAALRAGPARVGHGVCWESSYRKLRSTSARCPGCPGRGAARCPCRARVRRGRQTWASRGAQEFAKSGRR